MKVEITKTHICVCECADVSTYIFIDLFIAQKGRNIEGANKDKRFKDGQSNGSTPLRNCYLNHRS